MSQDAALNVVRSVPAWEGRLGAFEVQVERTESGGALVLTPAEGQSLRIRIEGGTLELDYQGPSVRFSAPQADLELAARNVTIRAEDTVSLHGRREVDLHSGEDLEIRADHQVNLWAHGVLVGD